MKEMTVVRIRILLSILHNQEKGITAAAIAQSLHVSKSTVSRAVEYFQRQKLVQEKKLGLTALGEKIVRQYWERKEMLVSWLVEKVGMERIKAEEEALTMILTVEPKTLEAFLAQIEETRRNCELGGIDGFCEKGIDYLLDDGQYDISFTIYKDSNKQHMKVSMANDGFHHPGQLLVKNGIGIIRLESKKVIRNAPLGNRMLAGQVDSIAYLDNHQYANAVHEGNVWKWPVSCMKFTYNKGEKILTGSAILKLSCSVGEIYMPESTAVVTIIVSL